MPLILDQYGREITVEKRPETDMIALAAVRDRWSTYPSSGMTPKRLGDILKEADAGDIFRQAELFEELEEKDTHLFSEFQTRKNAVLGLPWDILPASDSSEDKKIAEFIAEVLDELNDFEETMLDLLDAIPKGYSMVENMWAVDGNRVTIQGFEHIHAKRAVFWEYDKGPWEPITKVPRVMTEKEPVKGEEMPPFKMIYHRYKARSGHDTRAGIMRVCAWMYLFKNYSIKDWVSFAEIFGIPIRLGKYDPGANQDDKDALYAAIRSLGSDAAGIISKNTEIEFIEAVKNVRGNIFKDLATFCNAEQSKAILGQTLTTQEGESGSYSLGQVHDRVRHDLIKADCQVLSNTLRFQVIRPLVGYNYGWEKPLPDFKFHFEEAEDLVQLSGVYVNLSKIGQPITQEHVSKRFKVPLPQKGETVLEAVEGSPAEIPAKLKLIAAKSRRFTPQQERVEGLIASALDRSNTAISALTGPLKQIVLNSSSLEEIQEKIIAAYSDLDSSQLEDLLARATFMADLYGGFTAQKE